MVRLRSSGVAGKRMKSATIQWDEVRSSPFPSRRTQNKTTSKALGPSLAPPTLADSLVGNLLIEGRSSDGKGP